MKHDCLELMLLTKISFCTYCVNCVLLPRDICGCTVSFVKHSIFIPYYLPLHMPIGCSIYFNTIVNDPEDAVCDATGAESCTGAGPSNN